MSVSGGPDVVQDGLVLYVDTFNPRSYTSGSTRWTSVVGRATASILNTIADGTLYTAVPLAATSSTGIGSFAPIQFEPSSSRPEIYFDDRGSRFTISVWASVLNVQSDPTFGNTNRGIFARGSNLGGFSGYVGIHASRATTASATEIVVGTRGAAQSRTVTLNTNIITGSVSTAQIFNAVLVYDSSSLYGYFNGNLMGSSSTAVETLSFTGSQWLCNAYGAVGGNGGAATMSLYMASIHNRALTSQEVLQNFNAQRSRFGI